MKPAIVINDLWNQAMEEIDWDPKKGEHVLEISMDTQMSLQKERHFWWDCNCDFRNGAWYFRCVFKIVIIYEPLPEATYIAEPDKTVIPMFHHMALHVQRDNGRYRYYDWEGNDARCT